MNSHPQGDFIMPSNKLAWLAICIIFLLAISTSGCIGGKKTYDSEYMTFEYPEDWSIETSVSHGAAGEDVILANEYGDRVAIMACTNETLQTLEKATAEDLNAGRLKKETFNGVECSIYEGEGLRYYVFQKDGTVFTVMCNLDAKDVAEDIIKSIKPK